MTPRPIQPIHPLPCPRTRWPRRIRPLAALALLAIGACLPTGTPEVFAPMCESDSDCDAGEHCDVGICWGNPPDTRFAALLVPPSQGGEGLAATEIPDLAIASDGTVSNLSFADAATINGRVVLACAEGAPPTECDPSVSIDAQIAVRGPSRIPGQRTYARTATSRAGVPAGQPSFTLTLPIRETPYEVTVVPGGAAGRPNDISAAELAPPRALTLVVDDAGAVEWALGDPASHLTFTGRVEDAVGSGVAGMQVSAHIPSISSKRLSSLALTDGDGFFTLRVPDDLAEPLELVAVPTGPVSAPAVRMRDVVPGPEPTVVKLPSYGEPSRYTLRIEGLETSGERVPASGAEVRVTTELTSPDERITATFSTVQTSDDNGMVELLLIPGSAVKNRSYTASVVPPPGSQHAARLDYGLDIGSASGGFLGSIVLDSRVAVSAAVHDARGEAAHDTTVRVRFAASFLDALDPRTRAQVESLALPSVATSGGRLLVWLDASFGGIGAVYDLELEPPDPLAALGSLHGIEVPGAPDRSVELPPIHLPDASYARGVIHRHQPDGEPVARAELRLFEVAAECAVEGPDPACPPPRPRGLWTSDDPGGQVMMILPKP